MQKILVVGPVTSFGGYGASARCWADAFHAVGQDVRIASFDDYRAGFPLNAGREWYLESMYDTKSSWTPDFVFNANNPAGYGDGIFDQVCSTAWETDKLPPQMYRNLKSQKMVTVQSSFNETLFKQYHDNVHVVPLGIDTEQFKPDPVAHDRFTFFANGKWEYRKNLTNLVKTFAETFEGNDKVQLLIKTHPFRVEDAQVQGLIQAANRNRARVLVNLGDAPQEQLIGIYNSSDAFILPTRGEGFGVPFLEALSCGIPCIAPELGGHTDFVTKNNSLLIESQFKKCFPHSVYSADMSMVEPNLKALAQQMRYAVDNPTEMKRLGQNGRQDAQKYSLQNIGNKMLKTINENVVLSNLMQVHR